MSIDPVLTLDPSLGLVSSATVYLPNDVGLWRTVASLANGRPDGEGFATAVGAFDVKKRSSMTRGAGEAVERFALAPMAADSEHLLAAKDAKDNFQLRSYGARRATGDAGCAAASELARTKAGHHSELEGVQLRRTLDHAHPPLTAKALVRAGPGWPRAQKSGEAPV